MLVELNKQDLIHLITGIKPSYEQMGHPEAKANGDYSGSHDRWTWSWRAFKDEKYTSELLWQIYKELKDVG